MGDALVGQTEPAQDAGRPEGTIEGAPLGIRASGNGESR